MKGKMRILFSTLSKRKEEIFHHFIIFLENNCLSFQLNFTSIISRLSCFMLATFSINPSLYCTHKRLMIYQKIFTSQKNLNILELYKNNVTCKLYLKPPQFVFDSKISRLGEFMNIFSLGDVFMNFLSQVFRLFLLMFLLIQVTNIVISAHKKLGRYLFQSDERIT